MDISELAGKLLAWEQARKDLDALELEIEGAVLEIGKTQTVGNVRATYTSGRRVLDYEAPGKTAPLDVIDENTNTTEFVDWEAVRSLIDPDIITECTRETKSINWAAVCKMADLDPAVVKEGTPSVKIKLLS